ncbi:TetR/AcrR family transcriptional regulator [Hoyosella sp. G463]|uniref:TetR/AcrR family transcriptional regulator n=1 Tax=Lolliginicoccus lacisalsi TaxID=2742202 RepID=A0A927JC77_9ACTN|nr:TetR/AcrR family transcriptional regulator [Lolliginicoccus lacisalsi]
MPRTTHRPPRPDERPTDRRAVRWEDHKAARRQLILDSALTAIEVDGPAVGVSRIAEHAHVTRAGIYRFFRDRADLDYQIRAHIADKVLADLAPRLDLSRTPTELIHDSVHAYISWTTEHPHLHHFVGSRASRNGTAGPDVATTAKTTIATQIADLFTAVLDALDADTSSAGPLAFALVGLVDATVNRWRRSRVPEAAQLESLLCGWTLQLISSNMEALGVAFDPHIPLQTTMDRAYAAAGERAD